MGTRLTIKDKNHNDIYYGTKLYGYCIFNIPEEAEEYKDFLDSCKYLFDNNLIPEEKQWCFMYGDAEFSGDLKLTGKHLKEFIRLYAKDLDKGYTVYDTTGMIFLNLQQIKDILEKAPDDETYYIAWE